MKVQLTGNFNFTVQCWWAKFKTFKAYIGSSVDLQFNCVNNMSELKTPVCRIILCSYYAHLNHNYLKKGIKFIH